VLLCQDIVKGVYTSILACLAAGSSATVRTLSVGFDLAGIIGKHLDHLFHKLVHENNIEIFRVTTHTQSSSLSLMSISLLCLYNPWLPACSNAWLLALVVHTCWRWGVLLPTKRLCVRSLCPCA
jgi:hypothetical protein